MFNAILIPLVGLLMVCSVALCVYVFAAELWEAMKGEDNE